MLSANVISRAIEDMSLLNFFPPERAWPALVNLIRTMCSTDAEVQWLAARVVQVWNKWEGPAELRAVLCSKFRPADGVEGDSTLAQFSDGYPSERPQIAAPIPKQLTAAKEASNDEQCQEMARDLFTDYENRKELMRSTNETNERLRDLEQAYRR